MDVGNISNRTAKCISELDNVSKEKLGKVCKYFLQSLVKGSSNVALDESLDEPLCAVSTLLLEAAKMRSTTDQLKAVLTELGTGPEASEILVNLYSEHSDTLIEHIDATGIAAPTIIGVDWRLDYSIKSKNAGRENVSVFYVSLKVKDRGVVREINMIASIEELQDLLSKVSPTIPRTFAEQQVVSAALNMPLFNIYFILYLVQVRDAVKQTERVLSSSEA